MARRILCVDDDRETCEMMSALLGHEGYEVTQALGFSQGLSLSRKGSFDLIMLDWTYQDGGDPRCDDFTNEDIRGK